MSSTNYRPNNPGIARYLRSPELAQAVTSIAEDGKRYAESIAPRRPGGGEYASSFSVSLDSVRIGNGTRVAARLENTSGHAAAVEWGYAGRANAPGQSPHRVLGRTLEHLNR